MVVPGLDRRIKGIGFHDLHADTGDSHRHRDLAAFSGSNLGAIPGTNVGTITWAHELADVDTQRDTDLNPDCVPKPHSDGRTV